MWTPSEHSVIYDVVRIWSVYSYTFFLFISSWDHMITRKRERKAKGYKIDTMLLIIDCNTIIYAFKTSITGLEKLWSNVFRRSDRIANNIWIYTQLFDMCRLDSVPNKLGVYTRLLFGVTIGGLWHPITCTFGNLFSCGAFLIFIDKGHNQLGIFPESKPAYVSL